MKLFRCFVVHCRRLVVRLSVRAHKLEILLNEREKNGEEIFIQKLVLKVYSTLNSFSPVYCFARSLARIVEKSIGLVIMAEYPGAIWSVTGQAKNFRSSFSSNNVNILSSRVDRTRASRARLDAVSGLLRSLKFWVRNSEICSLMNLKDAWSLPCDGDVSCLSSSFSSSTSCA